MQRTAHSQDGAPPLISVLDRFDEMTHEVRCLALGGDPDHYGLLPPMAVELWRSIEKHCSTQWKNPALREQLLRIGGCLDKLSASLLQVSRLRAHHDHLLEMAKSQAGQGAQGFAIRGISALADFEGLLLHGRAALDRLTWFLTSSYPVKTSSFRKLRNVLSDFTGKRDDAPQLLAILDVVNPWFDALLAKLDAPESLRDLVGHKHSIAEGMETCFAVTYVSPSAALVFDCEVRLPTTPTPTPLLRSSCDVAHHLSFGVLNALAVVTGIPTLTVQDFQLTWALRTVVRSDFLVDEPDGAPRTENALILVRRMTPDGLEVTTRNYKPTIRGHVLAL